jgi:hypothetical protein
VGACEHSNEPLGYIKGESDLLSDVTFLNRTLFPEGSYNKQRGYVDSNEMCILNVTTTKILLLQGIVSHA